MRQTMAENVYIPRLQGVHQGDTPRAPTYGEESRSSSRLSSRPSSRNTQHSLTSRKYTSPRTGHQSHERQGRQSQSRYTSRSMPSRLTPLGTTPRPPKGGLQTPTKDISARYAKFYENARQGGIQTPYGFIKRSSSEECLKCMLKIPHDNCEGHKYLRVGGGYRHSYWYCKALLEELELQRQREELMQRRLEAIEEKQVKAIKTYIRTKSGRLVERVVFLSEEDYHKFKAGGGDALSVLKKYLSKVDAKNIHSYEKEEQKAITTWVRTKSGRRVQRTVYVSKDEYEAMKRGEVDARSVLKKYMKPDEVKNLEGWGEAEMKQIKTYVRTKSGRVIEKTIMVTADDYEKMKQMEKEGKDPNEILKNYMSLDEGAKIEGWKKEEAPPMKVIKAMVRTKSGKLVEKTILMTEDEFQKFQESGGDINMLKKFVKLGKDEVIEDWDKASTVYAASDDEEIQKGKPGTKITGKDGQQYEIVVDPLTGKKYKKKIGKKGDVDSGIGSMKGSKNKIHGKVGKGKIVGDVSGDPNEKGMTKAEVEAYRAGKRRDDSDSEYSYRSVVSAGGTRKVLRKKKNEDGTYGKEEEYDENKDIEGKARRQKRRNERKAKAIKEKIEKLKKGKRDADSDGSEFSYRSVVSAGGTRKVMRRRRKADGTYSREHSYHSSQDEDGERRRKKRREKRMEAMRQGKLNPDSDSEYSYRSVVSAGGTRKVFRKKKNADGTYGKEEAYNEDEDEAGKERRRKRRETRQKAFKTGKRRDGSDSDYSYRSVVSAGGTRHVRRKKKMADGAYADSESYHSSQDEDGDARRRRRRRERKHAGSAHSYYSVVSEGGTRHVRRKKKNADGTYAGSESYHSGDSDFYDKSKLKKKKKQRREHGADSDHSYYSEVSAGGTKHRKRKERIRDKHGKVIGYGKAEDYSSPSDSDEGGGGGTRKGGKGGKGKGKAGAAKGHAKKGKKGGGPDGNMTDFSEDLQSTDSEDEPDLSKMTEEEKQKYFEEKAKRKAEREKKRKEKYGDKYEEMKDKHQKAKEAKKQAKSMVDYAKGVKRFNEGGEQDDREHGVGHEKWGKKGKKKDGNEADDEGDGSDPAHKKKRKRITSTGSSISVESYFETDEDGTIKLKEGSKKIDLSKLSEDDLAKLGIDATNMTKEEIARALKEKFGEDIEIVDKGEEFDAGDYFEVGEDGQMKLKDGQTKIDLSKLTEEDLLKLGIDPSTMTKEEISRKLREKFGDHVEIMDKGEEFDDGDYFEMGSDGKMKLKGSKKKIDLSKLTDEDLKKMGIDPSKMTKEEIARELKKQFGEDLEIIDKGEKFDAGDYFTMDADGRMKLKAGTKKIDLSKMSKDDLRKLGIDTRYMTKEQIAKKLKEKFGDDIDVVDGNESDGDYFETGADGKVKMKQGKKKIDISKLTKEDLKKLGIDENATKEEIARALQEKFGKEITITKGGVKVGLKDVDSFDSDAETDDLAEDSDLDVSTLKGQQKVRVMMRRGGGILQEHMYNMIQQSNLMDDESTQTTGEAIDFVKHYQLVDQQKLDMYARAYVVEDEDLDYRIDAKAARTALEGVPTVKEIGEKQMDYVFKVLDLEHESNMTFRMFAVMTSLAERVTAMDEHCLELLRMSNLTDIERKMALYKAMFYCCSDGDTHPNYIKLDNLKIELMAGGLSWEQQDYVMEKMNPNDYREISFLDYLCYIPLYLSMHDKMLVNPLDNSSTKYTPSRPVSSQRDMNPLGNPLKKNSSWMQKNVQNQQANDLLKGKNVASIKQQNMELYNKYQKLPHIVGMHSTPGTAKPSKKTKPLF